MRHEEVARPEGVFPPADGAGLTKGLTELCPANRPPHTRTVGWLTAWAALRTIFMWPLCSCTFRKRQFRTLSTTQLNSLESGGAQSEVWWHHPRGRAPSISESHCYCPYFTEEESEAQKLLMVEKAKK